MLGERDLPTSALSVPSTSAPHSLEWGCMQMVPVWLRDHCHEPGGVGRVLGRAFFCLRKLLLGAGAGGLMGQRLEWEAGS